MKMKESNSWFTMPVESVLTQLGSTKEGLSRQDAEQRLMDSGPNELKAGQRTTPLTVFVGQFKNIFVIILLLAAGISAVLGHGVESLAIAVIVLFSVLLGFVQEFRAERAIEALREMAAPTATVLRAGEELEIPAREIVPGDIILLKAGDRVPADARLVEVGQLTDRRGRADR
jgi:P-type Ca2+ transporter type 2C